METKFTKGEWYYKQLTPRTFEINSNAKNRERFISVRSDDCISNMCTFDEAEANAKLIAAAPDMFDVLEIAQSALELCYQHMINNGDLSLWNRLAAPKLIEEVLKKATE